MDNKTKIESKIADTKETINNKISAEKEKIKLTVSKIQEENKIRKKQKALVKKLKWIAIIIISLTFLSVVGIFVYEHYFVRKEPEAITDTSSVLIEAKDIAKLEVANIIYNSVATIDKEGNVTQKVFSDKEVKKNVSYFISYKGEIKVDYDLSSVTIDTNDTTKEIIVSIPSPTLTPSVRDADFNHIFIDKKAENSYSPDQAKNLCLKDLNTKFEGEKNKLYEIAEDNCKKLITSYIEIFNENNYEIKFKKLEENSK